MLIILEGPDGAGKTTLADQLEERIRTDHPRDVVVRKHARPPTRHPLDEYLRPISEYRPGQGVHYILDRWHWGEDVYPTVRNRSTQLDEPGRWAIETFLARLGALVVYCTQYPEVYPIVYAKRNEQHQLAELPQVERLYRLVVERTLLPWHAYNHLSPVCHVTKIIHAAEYAQLVHAELNQSLTYSGPRWPEFLLFGDTRRLPKVEPNPWDPAFVPFPSTSGHFLHNALMDAGALRRFGVANACDVDDPADLWVKLGRPRVVALGRHAQRRLRKLDIPHGAVPHPQYVRRFHHAERARYGRLIGRALTTREDLITWPDSSTADMAVTSTLRFSRTSVDAANVARRATD